MKILSVLGVPRAASSVGPASSTSMAAVPPKTVNMNSSYLRGPITNIHYRVPVSTILKLYHIFFLCIFISVCFTSSKLYFMQKKKTACSIKENLQADRKVRISKHSKSIKLSPPTL
jgi:hypothetical protein